MPDRILRSSLLTSPNFNRYSLLAQNLAVRLILVVDDLGRYHGTATAVRAACFPEMEDRVSVADVEEALGELCAGSDGEAMIERYQIKRRVFLRFVNWATHQRLRSKTSRFPDPETGLTRADQARDAARMRWPAAERNADACNRNADAPGIGDGIGDGIDSPLPPTPPYPPYSYSDSYSYSKTRGGVGGSAPHAPAAAHEEPAAVGAGARADTQPALPSTPSKPASGGPPRDTPDPPPVPEWALALARFIAARSVELNPRYRAPTAAGLRKWAVEIDRLHRLDGQPVEEIERVLRWTMANSFWSGTVQSGKALRKHWNIITAQMARGGSGNGTHPGSGGRVPASERPGGSVATLGYTELQQKRQREIAAELGLD